KDEIAYVQSKKELFEWMIEQAELLEEKEKERAKWKGRYTKEKNAHKRYKNDMKYKWRRFRAAENKIDALEYVLAKREKQNKRYRDLLESIRYTQDIAKEIQVEKPNIKVITPDDLLQHILRKIKKELESESN